MEVQFTLVSEQRETKRSIRSSKFEVRDSRQKRIPRGRYAPDSAGGSYQRRGQLSPQLGAKDGVEQLIDCSCMRTASLASRRRVWVRASARAKETSKVYFQVRTKMALSARFLVPYGNEFAAASYQRNKDRRLTLWPWDYFRKKAQCRGNLSIEPLHRE